MYLIAQPQHLQSLQTSSRRHSFLLKESTHGKFTKTDTRNSFQRTLNTEVTFQEQGALQEWWHQWVLNASEIQTPPCCWQPDWAQAGTALQSTSKNNAGPRMAGVTETIPQSKGRRWNGVGTCSPPAPQLLYECGVTAWQQRNRQPKDFCPWTLGSYRGREGGDLLNYPSKNTRPQQKWPKYASCSHCV